ncbi:MAG: hypothetical protein F7C37_05040 [Desulfurococcales archaeon]|nr:hypothetical protein [Desulfurococcales archaeon]MCE4626601.1 hypothetical protein [Desulfurococcales archaeon]
MVFKVARVLDSTQLIGVIGMLLVFTSFTIRNWIWLYMFNLLGTLLLDVYAIIRRDAVFAALETGIAIFLAYRLVDEYRKSRRESSI